MYVGPVIGELYRRLLERNYAQDDPEVVILTAALTSFLRHGNREDRSTEVLLMAVLGEQRVLQQRSLRVMRWRNGALSRTD